MTEAIFDRAAYERQMDVWFTQLKLDVSKDKKKRLLDYLALLLKWNQAYNLTAVRDPEQMLSRHLMDSLMLIPHIEAERVLDVGTGPGLPGIPLSIIFPEKKWVLLDSNGKKTRFLFQCILELGLQNVDVVKSRAEAYQPGVKFAQIMSRAFTSLENMTSWCRHLIDENGNFLAMKGSIPTEEIQNMHNEFFVDEIVLLNVPGCAAERHLIKIGKRI